METKQEKRRSSQGLSRRQNIAKDRSSDPEQASKKPPQTSTPSPTTSSSQKDGHVGQRQSQNALLRPKDRMSITSGSSIVARCHSIDDLDTPIYSSNSFQDYSFLNDDSSISSCTVDGNAAARNSTGKPPLRSEGSCSDDNPRATRPVTRTIQEDSDDSGESYPDSSDTEPYSDIYDDVDIVDRRVIIKAKARPPLKSPKVCLIQTVDHDGKTDNSPTAPSQSNRLGLSSPGKPTNVKSLINMIENAAVPSKNEDPPSSTKKASAPVSFKPSPKFVPQQDDDHLYEEVSVKDTKPKENILRPKRGGAGAERGSGERRLRWSSYDESDDDDDEGAEWSDFDDEEKEYENLEEYAKVEIGVMEKDHQVVYEMMTTERTYVKKLQHLQQARKETEKVLGKPTAKDMFPYIESIYQLHKENLLPLLEKRLEVWRTTKKIGDIMKKLAPFLKLYTDYVKNFDKTLALMEQWQQKSHDFAKMVKKLQTTNATEIKVPLQTHMLEPVQRVPRYELLLKEYLKHSPKDSTDHADVQEALTSISEAARHFEARIQQATRLAQLIALQQEIESPVSIVRLSRHLVKKGKIIKVCKNGKLVNRYLFLFNDLLLLCKEQFIHIAGVTPKYQVKLLMELDGMQITDGDSLDVRHTFYVRTRQQALELAAENADGKGEWTQAMWTLIEEKMRENLKRKQSRRTRYGSIAFQLADPEKLGKKAPVFVHHSDVTQCMVCVKEFKAFRKKKHNCKGCGVVVCRLCSTRSLVLEYDPARERRVCDECYLQLQDMKHRSKIPPPSKLQHIWSRDEFLFREYLQLSEDAGRSWHRRVLAIGERGELLCFKAQQDIIPLISIMLALCDVVLLTFTKEKKEKVVHLVTPTKEYYVRDNSAEKLMKFLDTLGRVVKEAKESSTA